MNDIRISKKLLIGGLTLLLLGFVFMIVGNDTYSFWKLTFSPLIILAAFSLIASSLMHKTNVDV